MSANEAIPDENELDGAAAEWLFEREAGFTPERKREFAAWCASDPRHAEAVTRIERTLELLNDLPTVRAPLEERLGGAAGKTDSAANRPLLRFPVIGLAAAAVLALAFVSWWSLRSSGHPEEHYTADATAQRTLALSDGSVLDLNTGSEVKVKFTASERRITLQKGEAHFQVSHNPNRPFIVTAGDVSVRAVGTAFDVRLAKEAVKVVVVEGKVQLSRALSNAAPSARETPPLLRSGEVAQIVLNAVAAAPKIEQIDAGSISALLTWQNPMTSFTDVPLRDVIARFNRRNVTQLLLEDADLGERKIGGMIALDQVEAFVRLLEQDGDVVADRTQAGRIALRRAR
ncbi:hypothetical protein DB347_15110 [Opitutaceae bacterium EW11]|nr:hypothetical protein DB347_15110 [Opitutaceae bacterium EW11]